MKQGADYFRLVQLMPLHPKHHHLFSHLNPDWFLPRDAMHQQY